MTKSPKKRFMMNAEAAKLHAGIINSAAFVYAMDMAMLEYIGKLPSASVNEAAANAYRVEGAEAFREILENLGELPAVRQMTTTMPASLDTSV